jgi:hypothetical protein
MLTFGHQMVKTYRSIIFQNTRLCLKYSLVFFLLGMMAACKPSVSKIEFVWNNKRATGIAISKNLVSDHTKLSVTLANSNAAILGDVVAEGDNYVFKPLIPLSTGLTYFIYDNGAQIGNIIVPEDVSSKTPQLLAIYPTIDTLPENALKIYLQFSKPMRTGQALDYVTLLDKNKDTMRNVFLNLQPELWDTTGKVLTLWLDPGRIKRDLILNRELGNPLKRSERYQLIVSGQWKDSYGIPLGKAEVKKFIAGPRNDQAIDINKWSLTIPKAGTTEALVVNTGRSLDHFLFIESISVTTVDDKSINSTASVLNSDKDRIWKFKPHANWKTGTYILKVNTRLEDLAGNNLNKVFDRDITRQSKKDGAFALRSFVIKN